MESAKALLAAGSASCKMTARRLFAGKGDLKPNDE